MSWIIVHLNWIEVIMTVQQAGGMYDVHTIWLWQSRSMIPGDDLVHLLWNPVKINEESR